MDHFVTGRDEAWEEACIRAATNGGFSNFRSTEAFQRVVGGTPAIAGKLMAGSGKNDRFCGSDIEFAVIDKIGGPRGQHE